MPCRGYTGEQGNMNKSGKKHGDQQEDLQFEEPEFEHTGQYLQKLRTEKGLTIKDVVQATRISEINLNAIESQDFSTLPADTFTRGFLAMYARYLGLDPKEIVHNFLEERDGRKVGGRKNRAKHTGKILAPKTLAEPSHFSSVTAAFILLIIIILLFTAFCFYTSWNPFSFMTGKNKSLQSFLMSVVPQPGTTEEHPYSKYLQDNAGAIFNRYEKTTKETQEPVTKSESSETSFNGGNSGSKNSSFETVGIPLIDFVNSAYAADADIGDTQIETGIKREFSFFEEQKVPGTDE